MAMLEYLEKDKEKVLAELVSAALPERAVKVLESELDRLLYQYNESEEEERLRSAASAMTETAKISLSYLNAMGEPKIWERYEDDDPNAPTKKPIPVIAWIFLLVGAAMPFAALVLADIRMFFFFLYDLRAYLHTFIADIYSLRSGNQFSHLIFRLSAEAAANHFHSACHIFSFFRKKTPANISGQESSDYIIDLLQRCRSGRKRPPPQRTSSCHDLYQFRSFRSIVSIGCPVFAASVSFSLFLIFRICSASILISDACPLVPPDG